MITRTNHVLSTLCTFVQNCNICRMVSFPTHHFLHTCRITNLHCLNRCTTCIRRIFPHPKAMRYRRALRGDQERLTIWTLKCIYSRYKCASLIGSLLPMEYTASLSFRWKMFRISSRQRTLTHLCTTLQVL
jgi:hypothetical protein